MRARKYFTHEERLAAKRKQRTEAKQRYDQRWSAHDLKLQPVREPRLPAELAKREQLKREIQQIRWSA